MKYTGVGARDCPNKMLGVMQDMAFKLSQEGWVLRSGGARGADTAFEIGALNSFSEEVPEIYLPWAGFNEHTSTSVGVIISPHLDRWGEAQRIAQRIHPAWNKLSPAARTLHSRNCFQVLGEDLNTPSKFLVCWAKTDTQGVPVGGTRTAYVLAQERCIPCFNLIFEETLCRIQRWIDK